MHEGLRTTDESAEPLPHPLVGLHTRVAAEPLVPACLVVLALPLLLIRGLFRLFVGNDAIALCMSAPAPWRSGGGLGTMPEEKGRQRRGPRACSQSLPRRCGHVWTKLGLMLPLRLAVHWVHGPAHEPVEQPPKLAVVLVTPLRMLLIPSV